MINIKGDRLLFESIPCISTSGGDLRCKQSLLPSSPALDKPSTPNPIGGSHQPLPGLQELLIYLKFV